ncbi:MAG: ABC transporter permease [Spirochaetales bacterium]|nr:ABC transporter permease [Spirochaetales bacterium]
MALLKIGKFIFFEIIVKTVLICIASTFFVYILMNITPKAYVKELQIRYTDEKNHGEEAAATGEKTADTGFPLFYFNWLKNVLDGNLGRSYSGQNLTEEITSRFIVTFALTTISLIPTLILSLLLGCSKNTKSMSIIRNSIYVITVFPAFLLGYFFFGIFGANFLIAVITLIVSSSIINEFGRIISNAMKSELKKDYMETAAAKGLKEALLPLPGTRNYHAFRNALITIIPRICVIFTLILNGSMIVEQVFRIPGLSYTLFDGLADKDTSRVLIVILLVVFLVRVVSILSNFFYYLVNPRYGLR